jgi:molybdopterin converting factor subunit 1
VKVLLFSVLREKVGTSEMSIEIERAEPVSSFLSRVAQDVPAVAEFESAIRLAVNGSYAQPADIVEPGDEVALITPVSGG